MAYGMPVNRLRNLGSQASLAANGDADAVALGAQGGVMSKSSDPEEATESAAAEAAEGSEEGESGVGAADSSDKSDDAKNMDEAMRPRGADGEPLTDSEMDQLKELERSDSEIRAHEQAHLSAAGGLARGGMKFEYATGPDGKRYAVGGEVSIDASAEGDPDETLRKMQQVRAAAMAPANPSAQDRRVASVASQRMNEARQQITKDAIDENREEQDSQAAEQENAADESGESGGLVKPESSKIEEGDTNPAFADISVNNNEEPGAGVVSPAMMAREEDKSSFRPASFDTAGIANSFAAARAYAAARRPEVFTPEVRAAQPGPPTDSSIGAIPTLKPPAGSVADF
ncbi:MAG: hypothetical protein JXR97_14080 [Planctomycetes bacterium]|nr:hypothetical protein [Planctomycetota bacterium]